MRPITGSTPLRGVALEFFYLDDQQFAVISSLRQVASPDSIATPGTKVPVKWLGNSGDGKGIKVMFVSGSGSPLIPYRVIHERGAR